MFPLAPLDHVMQICSSELVHRRSIVPLTHWGRDKMAAVSQTMFSNAFSWMKMYAFRLKFHWSLFLRFQLTIFQYWFRWWLGADQATSHYLNQRWLVYWRIYASLGLNELKLLNLKLDINRFWCIQTYLIYMDFSSKLVLLPYYIVHIFPSHPMCFYLCLNWIHPEWLL